MKMPFISLVLILFAACSKSNNTTTNTTTNNPPPTSTFTDTFYAKGADISWVTEMESIGTSFYNHSGTKEDAFQLMKDIGFNSIRLRVWVNPSNSWCNTSDVINKAVRANQLGLKIMIDFHYSDSWADPGNQNKPVAWSSQGIQELQTSIYDHTTHVLNALKASGVSPKWVQVGNETNDGMLWPEGKASVNMVNFALLVNAGYNAVKSVDTSIKVIVHISNGYDNALFRWMFDGLKANNAKWDIIGMSLYPSASNWQSLNDQCLTNMNDMVSRYNKDVMICETGMSWTDSTTCKAFLTDLISKTKSVSNNRGKGVFYWEPEAYNNWQGYTLGAFDNNGKPTIALDAFK
jgi:arabinogalactan endo-1,4-beta-galactosidase